MLDNTPVDGEHEEIVEERHQEEDEEFGDLLVLPEAQEIPYLLELMEGQIVVEGLAAQEAVEGGLRGVGSTLLSVWNRRDIAGRRGLIRMHGVCWYGNPNRKTVCVECVLGDLSVLVIMFV